MSKYPEAFGDLGERIETVLREFAAVPLPVLEQYISPSGFQSTEDKVKTVKYQLKLMRFSGAVKQDDALTEVRHRNYNPDALSRMEKSIQQELRMTSWVLAAYGEDRFRWFHVPPVPYCGMVEFILAGEPLPNGDADEIGCDAVNVHYGNLRHIKSYLQRRWHDCMKTDDGTGGETADTFLHMAVISCDYMRDRAFMQQLSGLGLFDLVCVVDPEQQTCSISRAASLPGKQGSVPIENQSG